MSTLIVQLPAQPRLSTLQSDAATLAPPAELFHVYSADGLQAVRQGSCAPEKLPKAQTTVAVLPPGEVAWHRVTAPKAPAAKLRAALAGMLEESLLDDDADLHLAVAPDWKAGEPGWVAVVGKAWLKAQIDALEAHGLQVDRVAPAWAPSEVPAAHVFRPAEGQGAHLAWRDADGPLCLPLAGDGARGLLARLPRDQPVRWTASPDCADEGARLAGDTVAALSTAEFLLAAARSPWNLRQFDMAQQHRGARLVQEGWRRFISEQAWRPVRWGALSLVLLQLAGINAWAWQQRQALAQRKAAMTSLLQATFPSVRAVIDAPAQMQKEIDLLRTAAGQPGDTDLEPLLYAAEAAWPPSRGPAESLKFEPGKLTVGSPGWTPPEIDGFRARLRPMGLDAEAAPGRLVVSRLAPGAPALSPPMGGTHAPNGVPPSPSTATQPSVRTMPGFPPPPTNPAQMPQGPDKTHDEQ